MDSLRKYLETTLREEGIKIKDKTDKNDKIRLKNLTNAHVLLTIGKAKTADYTTSLKNINGGESLEMKNRTTLQDSIEITEKEYIKKNKTLDIKAKYSVKINLGEVEIDIPEKYWKKYIRQ